MQKKAFIVADASFARRVLDNPGSTFYCCGKNWPYHWSLHPISLPDCAQHQWHPSFQKDSNYPLEGNAPRPRQCYKA
eukprot:11347431-Ditylum_brightwellii.AAC.1